MDSDVEKEFKKVLKALKCKASCNILDSLTVDNGLTKTLNNIQLGGSLIQDTVLSFDPNTIAFTLGDTTSSEYSIYGKIAPNITAAAWRNVDVFAAISRSNEGTTLDLHSNGDALGNTPEQALIMYKANNYNFGLFNGFDVEGVPFTNLYYSVVGANVANVKDTSRILCSPTRTHLVHIIDPTGVIENYNGIHVYPEYAQIEFNKDTDDGQSSGKTWTIDTDGASLWISGVRQFRIKNSIDSYADDAAAITGGLITGDVYKTTTLGSTYLKIVP